MILLSPSPELPVRSSLRLLPFRKQILFQHQHWNQKKPLSTCSSSIAIFKCRASTEMRKAVVVGAGPAGCLISHYLVERGFNVQVFERHAPIVPFFPSDDDKDERLYAPGDSRSYPLVITPRALKAIEGAGLELPASFFKPLVGSCVHISEGKKYRANYSNRSDLESYSVSRNKLVSFFQESISQRSSDGLTLNYGWELVELSNDKTRAYFSRSKPTGEKLEVQFDLLVGADGISSKVRSELIRLDNLHNNPLPLTMQFTKHPSSYKSFYIRPSLAQASPLYADRDCVQAWPKLNMLLVNVADGSFWGGSQNAELVQSTSSLEVENLFKKDAPEVYELLVKENPNFSEDFVKQPAIPFGGAVILSRFHDDNIVLIGDAAHAMFPSYGTGCNAALEDCKLFNNILKDVVEMPEKEDPYPKVVISKATSEFTKRRLADAHAIVEMNSNFKLFNRGRLGMLQTIFYKTLQAWFPSFIGLTAYQMLWTEAPFTKIKQKKQLENTLFYSFMAIAACALAVVISLLVRKMIIP